MPFQALQLDLGPAAKLHADDVALAGSSRWPARPDVLNLIERSEEALRPQETRCQFAVMARSPHGDGNRPVYALASRLEANANLQRLFDRERIGLCQDSVAMDFLNGNLHDARP